MPPSVPPARRASSRRLGSLLIALTLAPTIVSAWTATAGADPATVAPMAPGAVSQAASHADPDLLRSWLLGGTSGLRTPESASAFLADLVAGDVPAPAGPGSWDAFFAAFHETPSASERRALAAFESAHPHVAVEVRRLAADVAQAQVLRDAAFAKLTPEDWAAIPSAVALVVAGKGADLPEAQATALARVDLTLLARAGALLADVAEQAAPRLRAAQDLDARLPQKLPAFDPASLDKPSDVIATVSAGAPLATNASLVAAVSALELASGNDLAFPDRPIPADIATPLANILSAEARALSKGEPNGARDALATVGADLDALSRAAFNLSLAPAGEIEMLGGGSRALARAPSATGQRAALDLVLQDEFGVPVSAAPNVPLAEALRDAEVAFGAPIADAATVDALSSALGPQLSSAVGALLAAQVRYQDDLAPDAPVPAAARDAIARAEPILASSAPLSSADLSILRDASTKLRALRVLEGADASAILGALSLVQDAPHASVPLSATGPLGSPILFDDGIVLVADDTDKTLAGADSRMLLVSLGGNDTYTMPVGGAYPGPLWRTSVAVDLGGSDTYLAQHPYTLGGAQGDGFGPTLGVLLDVNGDDRYDAPDIPAMGTGLDGFGLLLDAAGNDTYASRGKGLAVVNTTSFSATALGVVIDAYGRDNYTTQDGFGRILPGSTSVAVAAAFFDLAGNDGYARPCPKVADPFDGRTACFGTARPLMAPMTPESAGGAAVFVDGGGTNVYPRSGDPMNTDSQPAAPVSAVDPAHLAIVEDVTQEYDLEMRSQFCPVTGGPANTCTPPGSTVIDVADRNGNGIPDFVENGHNPSPYVPWPTDIANDNDQDGWPNGIEWALGTDPLASTSYPVGIPPPPSPIPDPTGLLPVQSAATAPKSNGFMINIPNVLAIGLPGETVYDRDYIMSIDLGTADDSRDRYLNAPGLNGIAIDLAGDDLYAPKPIGTFVPPAFGAAYPRSLVSPQPNGVYVNGSDQVTNVMVGPTSVGPTLAAFIDLAGSDTYRGDAFSFGSSTMNETVAFFLDAAGDDTYSALNGTSFGYTTEGGPAYFLDLAGDDTYFGPTQGVVDTRFAASTFMPTGLALFLDVAGDDKYDRRLDAPLASDDLDAIQGVVGMYDAGRVHVARGGSSATAAFLDLDGDDKFLVTDGATEQTRDITSLRQDRLRVTPVDDLNGTALGLFLDTDAGTGAPGSAPQDADNDGASDLVEEGAGTDPNAADDTVANAADFLLDLPRLGLAVGASGDTHYRAARAYALVVDVGGDNVYEMPTGASSPRFPTSLALSLGGTDLYAYDGGTGLSNYTAFRAGNFTPATSPIPYVDVHYGGAQGSGVLGVGILMAAGQKSVFHASTSTVDPLALGAFQGAGILGVGALIVPGGASSTIMSADVTSRAIPGARLGALAHGASQGAGIVGIGVLAELGPQDDGRYWINATLASDPVDVDAKAFGERAAGQGYGERGVGMLLDLGGNNVFRAGGLAQGAAEGIVNSTLGPTGSSSISVQGQASLGIPPGATSALGLLFLPGTGKDDLAAGSRSQAFASNTSLGLVYDAEGDDELLVTSPDGLGQAAAINRGVALLLSDRGNDHYRTLGNASQGFADAGGVAMLVDLSGADTYEAPGDAQAQVGGAGINNDGASLALLLDRTGNDLYILPPNRRGQADVPAAGLGAGVAVLVDAGGVDRYYALSDHTSDGVQPTSPHDGGKWQATRPAGNYFARGIDDATATEAFATLLDSSETLCSTVLAALVQNSAVAPICMTSPTAIARIAVAGPPLTSYKGSVTFLVTLTSAGGALTATSAPEIDRVEIYANGSFLGQAALDTGQSAYAYLWSSAKQLDGVRQYPDGLYDIEARVYPRAGSPLATDSTGARFAVDPEPFVARALVPIDNAPILRAITLPVASTAPMGTFVVPTWIDRDLEQGCTPSCIEGSMGYLRPGADEWRTVSLDDPGLLTTKDTCTTTCIGATAATAKKAGGATYLTWRDPASTDGLVGYRIQRNVSGALTQIAFIDVRSTMLLHLPSGDVRFWIDPAPGAATAYAIDALRTQGDSVISTRVDVPLLNTNAPGPTRGIAAMGVENAVYLTWRPTQGAALYEISRSEVGPYVRSTPKTLVGTATGTTYADLTAEDDKTYEYSVTAVGDASSPSTTRSVIPSLSATAKPAPGENVTITATSAQDGSWTLLSAAPVGGAQLQRVAVNVSTLPDGAYTFTTRVADKTNAPVTTSSKVILDRTAPVTHILLDPIIGGPVTLKGGVINITYSVDEAGSGVRSTDIWARLDDGPWTPLHVAKEGSVAFPQLQDGSLLQLVPVSVDQVGNVEGLTHERPWTPTAEDGYVDLLKIGAVSTHLIDASGPVGPSRSLDIIAKPGETVTITQQLADAGTGVARAELWIGTDHVDMTTRNGVTFTGSWIAHGDGGQIFVKAFDPLGNEGDIPVGVVTIDQHAPHVASATATFGTGLRVARPGDIGRLRIAASDDLTAPGHLTILVNATNISTAGLVPLRYDAGDDAYSGQFVADRTFVGDFALLPYEVLDAAGNRAAGVINVSLDGQPTTISAVNVTTSADRAIFTWTTADPAAGRILYGPSPKLEDATQPDALALNHTVVVANLTPDTQYYAKIEVTNAAGVVSTTTLLAFHTTHGLEIVIEPVRGFPISDGTTILRASLRLFDGTPVAGRLHAQLATPRGGSASAAALDVPEEGAEFPLRLDTLADGTYGLILTAETGSIIGALPSKPLVLDRAPPVLDITRRALYVDEILRAHVEERGSGVDVANVSWSFQLEGGTTLACPAELTEGTLRCRVPDLNDVRSATMVLLVPDRAGNVGRLEIQTPIRNGPPDIARATVADAAGHTRLRPGTKMDLAVQLVEIEGSTVRADLSDLGGPTNLPLSAGADGVFRLSYAIPTRTEDGAHSVTVTVVDPAGKRRSDTVAVTVDSLPPTVDTVDVSSRSPLSADVDLGLDEPATVDLVVADAAERVVVTSAIAQTHHTLHVDGLRPAENFTGALTIVDLAGNAINVDITIRSADDLKPPTGVTAQAKDLGDGHVRLSWSAATDNESAVAAYVIRRTTPDGTTTAKTVSATSLDDEVAVGSPTRYAISAVDLGHNEGPTSILDVVSRGIPHILGGEVVPPLGGPGRYLFRATIVDADADAPQMWLFLDGEGFAMTRAGDGTCVESCSFVVSLNVGPTTLANGPHAYSFQARSPIANVVYPDDAPLEGPTVVAGAAPPDVATVNGALRVSTLGTAAIATAVVAAAATISILWRRRR